jgi:subtilisin family serine protease
MNSRGEPLDFSNWGEMYRSHGILAPGENIPVALPGGSIAARTGTSYATAIVTGIAALLISRQKKTMYRQTSMRYAMRCLPAPSGASISPYRSAVSCWLDA